MYFFCQNMVTVACHDYGHDCDFIIDGDLEHVVVEYKQHSDNEHGIEYTKETLEQRFMELEVSQ